MWLIDWLLGQNVEMPARARWDDMAAARRSLKPLVEKLAAEEAKKHGGGVMFSRSDISIGSRSPTIPPKKPNGAGTGNAPTDKGDTTRYSIGSGIPHAVLPESIFDSAEGAGAAKAIAGRIAAEPREAPGETFSKALLALVVSKYDGAAPMAYKRAGISRQSYSRIISSHYARVDKLTAMRLCIGLQLTYDESVSLLKDAGYAFSESIPMDSIFAYCIRHRILNILDVNRIITDCGQKPFDIVF